MAARQDRPAVRTPGSRARSMLGMGGLMLIACLGGPALVGALAGLGIGVLLGAGVAVVALALCVAVPTAAVALRRGSIRPPPTAAWVARDNFGRWTGAARAPRFGRE